MEELIQDLKAILHPITNQGQNTWNGPCRIHNSKNEARGRGVQIRGIDEDGAGVEGVKEANQSGVE